MNDTAKMIIKILLLVAAIVVGGVLILQHTGRNAAYYITHEETWETVTKDEYSMKMPAKMTKGRALQTSGITALDGFYNDEVSIYISKWELSAEEQRVIKTTSDLTNLFKSGTRTVTVGGKTLQPVVSGNMVYVEYPKAALTLQDGIQCNALCGNYLSGSTVYQVEIACREELYDQYESYLFKWLRSFHVSAA